MNKEDLLFIPLGGTGEIGMNLSLYHYQGKWLIIDCGAGFADEDMPGVDLVVADISFIVKNRHNLLGIVLTHAHEDHIGGIQFLWPQLQCPIYTTNFTANFLQTKLRALKQNIPIHIVDFGAKLQLGPFCLDFISMTHSIPEMNALAIHTDAGVVLHSGDWKFDSNPVTGALTDIEKLKSLGEKGVLALVCDSTNVFSPGKSGSESDLHEPFFNILKESNSLVAITLFASNVARINTIAEIAKQLNKHVVILGRSLINVVESAKKSGYLEDYVFLEAEAAKYYRRDQLILLCTGCQGDVLAATNKLATNQHPVFKLEPNDLFIFSAKIIPGNEKSISNIINKLVKMNVSVITEKTHTVHVSGHPYRGELEEMYNLVKPQFSIPVHGEHIHLYEHAKFAQEVCGVSKALIISDGDVIKLSSTGAELVEKVKSGFLCVDGNALQDPQGPVLKMRRKMQYSGIIIVILTMNQQHNLLKKPSILTFGYVDNTKLCDKISSKISKKLSNMDLNNRSELIKSTRSEVKKILKTEGNGKIPSIEIQIEKLSHYQ